MRSFFQDFKRDDGSPVTVEYHYEDGGNCACIADSKRGRAHVRVDHGEPLVR